MTTGALPIVFLLVLVPIVGAMLAWVVWSVIKICQPLGNSLDEWELLSIQLEDTRIVESSLVGVRQIQQRQRGGRDKLGEDYSYTAGQNLGYGIPVSWLQNLGERKN